jgi:hypothetical protein
MMALILTVITMTVMTPILIAMTLKIALMMMARMPRVVATGTMTAIWIGTHLHVSLPKPHDHQGAVVKRMQKKRSRSPIARVTTVGPPTATHKPEMTMMSMSDQLALTRTNANGSALPIMLDAKAHTMNDARSSVFHIVSFS